MNVHRSYFYLSHFLRIIKKWLPLPVKLEAKTNKHLLPHLHLQPLIGDFNAPEDNPADIPGPNPAVTMSVADLQAIQQTSADLEAAQQNTRRRRRSDSESDHERAPKRSNHKGKDPDEYWGETHQKLDAFIRQCEQNFPIDACTRDKTRVAYTGSYCRETPQTQWEEYERGPKHREPHVITWTEMKKELRRQLGKEHVYINEMDDRWQKAPMFQLDWGLVPVRA